VTASNRHYYGSLQFLVYLVHKHFSDYKLIVYDLGLTFRQRRLVKTKKPILITIELKRLNVYIRKSITDKNEL
jgi:hypothetical protein